MTNRGGKEFHHGQIQTGAGRSVDTHCICAQFLNRRGASRTSGHALWLGVFLRSPATRSTPSPAVAWPANSNARSSFRSPPVLNTMAKKYYIFVCTGLIAVWFKAYGRAFFASVHAEGTGWSWVNCVCNTFFSQFYGLFWLAFLFVVLVVFDNLSELADKVWLQQKLAFLDSYCWCGWVWLGNWCFGSIGLAHLFLKTHERVMRFVNFLF